MVGEEISSTIHEQRERCRLRLTSMSQKLFVSELSPELQEQLDLINRNAVASARVFIQRCLEAIELVDIITFEGDLAQFVALQKYLPRDQLLAIQDFTLGSIISGQENLIRKLLEASVQVSQ